LFRHRDPCELLLFSYPVSQKQQEPRKPSTFLNANPPICPYSFPAGRLIRLAQETSGDYNATKSVVSQVAQYAEKLMLILPIGTSIRPRRTPYVNYALIVVNVLLFLATYTGPRQEVLGGAVVVRYLRPFAEPYMLYPAHPRLYQFLTYAFLHGGFLHVFGNMYFLYLFGNNVNDRLGNVKYLLLYLAGAVFAAIGHSLVSPVPVLGASGAVAAITGAYLVLFPQTVITILYWFFFIGTLEILALYFILFKLIVWDNIIEPHFAPAAIAYEAHLAGYAFGIASMFLLLALGLAESGGIDLYLMIKQWNRRRRFRDIASEGYDPFSGYQGRKRIRVRQVTSEAEKKRVEQINDLRNRIGQRMAERNLPAAAALYLELMGIDPHQIPPRQYLLDIANQLASENKHAEAAEAYEKFLAHYHNYEYVEQVQLMLGLIYSRYLNKPRLAVKHLSAAQEKLTDPAQLKMCREELEKLQR